MVFLRFLPGFCPRPANIFKFVTTLFPKFTPTAPPIRRLSHPSPDFWRRPLDFNVRICHRTRNAHQDFNARFFGCFGSASGWLRHRTMLTERLLFDSSLETQTLLRSPSRRSAELVS
ncbi:hypothetical protein R3P38DRAFT_3205535 [Favolaschia claudopus]|uniref:Uncharacterized protein n=1 Tax=Favolaschia claudopus TaxID=2862362 RepID=A0AAW0AN09_9AGAR